MHPLTEIQDLQLPETNAQNKESHIITHVNQRQTCNERPGIILNKDIVGQAKVILEKFSTLSSYTGKMHGNRFAA